MQDGDLSARIRQLEDREAIRQLVARYGVVIDDRDIEGIGLCFTRDGYVLANTGLSLFNRLRRRGFIASHGGAPYRITQPGLRAVRAQLDNR